MYIHRAVVGVLSTIVLMTPTPVKAGWELLGGSDKKMYFDPDTIEKKGNVTRYWSAIVLETPKNGVSAFQMYNFRDCRKDVLSTIRTVGYDLEGKVMADEKSSFVHPRFIGVFMHDFVCNK